MTDDNEQPAWNEVLAKAREVLARANATLEREFAENPALREQAVAILKNAQALARDGLWPRPVSVRVFPHLVAPSMDATMRELMPADPPADVVVHAQASTAHATAPSPAIRTSFTASGSTDVEPKRGLFAGLSPGQIMALALIWVIAYLLPILQLMMPTDISLLVANDVAAWGFAYAITCEILKRR